MPHHRQGGVSITAVSAQTQPHHCPPYPSILTSLPVHLSHVSTARRKNSDETFLGTENSLPPPCSLLYLHPLPAASVVCCFHRKLARRPPRWISCIARYLPVKVFYGFCIHLLLSVSRSLSLSHSVYLCI